MDGHAWNREHAFVARGAAEVLITLVHEEGLLVLKVAVAIIAKDTRERI